MSPPRGRRRPRPRRTGRSSYVPYTVSGPPRTPGLPVDPPDRRRTPRTTLGGTPPRGDVVGTTVHRRGCATACRVLSVTPSGVGAVLPFVDLGLQGADVGQVPVALGVVQAVADDELVRDVEADVAHRDLDLDRVGFAQQRADLEAGRLPAAEVLQQPGQGEAGVDDVLEHQHVLA